MVKGNIHQREIVHESPSVELGLYTISVKCYKINEKIYNHTCTSIHTGFFFVESMPSSSSVCIECTTNLLTLGINKHSVQ